MVPALLSLFASTSANFNFQPSFSSSCWGFTWWLHEEVRISPFLLFSFLLVPNSFFLLRTSLNLSPSLPYTPLIKKNSRYNIHFSSNRMEGFCWKNIRAMEGARPSFQRNWHRMAMEAGSYFHILWFTVDLKLIFYLESKRLYGKVHQAYIYSWWIFAHTHTSWIVPVKLFSP